MKPPRIVQRGFSLVELMVGVGLTMVIALALLTLMANVSRNNTELARTNSVIENGRFALQLLETDIAMGGYWAGYVPKYDDISLTSAPTDFPTAIPNPCPIDSGTGTWAQPSTWTSDYKNQLVTIPVQVYQYTSGSAPICAGSSTDQGPLYGTSVVQPYTDILVVRHAAPCAASSTGTEDDCKDTAGNLFIQYGRCTNTFVMSATSGDFTLQNGNCSTTASKYRVVSTIYWVRNYFSTSGDGIPTLVRTKFSLSGGVLKHQGTESLVDGVEAFRVQIGVDNKTKPTTSGGSSNTLSASSFTAAPTFAVTTNTYTPTNRGDGNADEYKVCTASGTPCQDAFNLANTVSVKLFVLARATSTTPGYTDKKVYCLASSCATTTDNSCPASGSNDKLTLYGPYCDGYKRHVYSQTIRMMNISMRREVPNSW